MDSLKILIIVTTFNINSQSFTPNLYGQHFPSGEAAVNYIYEPDGMWKNLTSIKYKWNYYKQWSTSNHPYDKNKLIQEADGSTYYTARDANGYLLCDSDQDLEIDDGVYCGFAFHEHSGKGSGGSSRGSPFTQFWLDDNWLARSMSESYFRPPPTGLTDQNSFMRWKIISGDPNHWVLYNSTHFDTLALDGLYFLAVGNVGLAMEKWEMSLILSGAIATSDGFIYPGIHENYHMGLWAVLTEFILGTNSSRISKTILVQHSVSLRANILNNQEVDESGKLLGWASNIPIGNSLINSESISCGVLGLGANSRWVFEASKSPMMVEVENNFIIRPNHVVSALMGYSTPGRMSFGPYFKLPPGVYSVEFVLRASGGQFTEEIAVIDVYDWTFGEILKRRVLSLRDFEGENLWSRIGIEVTIDSAGHDIEFRTHWTGASDLDISSIRIK